MVSYTGRRFIQAVIIVIVVSLLVFLMMRLLPGDPLLMFISQGQYDLLTEEQVANIKHDYGLDKPLMLQYFSWLNNLVHGDLGKSLYYHQDVTRLIANRLPTTLHLGITAFVIGNILGVVVGVISALRRARAADLLVTILANIGITIPAFWLGILLVYSFGLKLGWLPIHGYTSPLDDFWLSTRQMIMPVICLSVFTIGAVARQSRSAVLEVVRQDYIRTAWSKGLKERTIVFRHILKNSLIPIVTLSGMQVSYILGGSVLIESVFNISGMGRLAVEALQGLDYAVVQATTLITAVMVVMANFVVDISYSWFDPRIRLP
jgi:peptide/nickel transport system permease protein